VATSRAAYFATEPSGSNPGVLLKVSDAGEVTTLAEIPGGPTVIAADGDDVVVGTQLTGAQAVVMVRDGGVSRIRELTGDASIVFVAIRGDRVLVGRNLLEAGGVPVGVDIELSEDRGHTWRTTTDKGGYLSLPAELRRGRAYVHWDRPGKHAFWWSSARGKEWQKVPGLQDVRRSDDSRVDRGMLWYTDYRDVGQLHRASFG
jgi:hypothetical protein